MPMLIEDLLLALRTLRRAPGFAVTAVLTLALGIGATTAIFTLVYDVMLRPLRPKINALLPPRCAVHSIRRGNAVVRVTVRAGTHDCERRRPSRRAAGGGAARSIGSMELRGRGFQPRHLKGTRGLPAALTDHEKSLRISPIRGRMPESRHQHDE